MPHHRKFLQDLNTIFVTLKAAFSVGIPFPVGKQMMA